MFFGTPITGRRAQDGKESVCITSGYYPVSSSWLSNGNSFIGTIVENLQLNIRDVHRIQEAKQRTKEEFTRNINQSLEGRNYHDRKFWDVMLDLRCQSSLLTLKLMVSRLLGTDYGGRKAACTETVETNSPD